MERLTDEVDQADQIERLITDKRIAGIRKEAAGINTTNPSGECLWCGEETGTERRWCNHECMKMYCVEVNKL